MRFLVSELLSILYFTLLYSELRLARLAEKQRNLALGNMPLMISCSDQGINLKACEVQERCSDRGCEGVGGGAKPPSINRNKKILQISAKFRKKKCKIDHISKTNNHTEEVIHTKNERQINSNLSCKFGFL